MPLSDVVTINITKQTAAPTRAGFGTPLCMVYHSVTASKLVAYDGLKGITDAGFPDYHPAVKMATKIFAQNPRPSQLLIGKRALPFTQTVEIAPVITTAGHHYIFTVTAPDGTSWDIDYTVAGGATVATICTALAPLIKNGHADITATAAATKVTIVCAIGKLFDLSALPPMAEFTVKDITANPGIATDLSAIEVLDATTWYGISLDYAGKASTLAAAAWTEARRKLLGVDASDSECADIAITNDVGSSLKASAYARTFTLFSQSQLLSYGAAAWMGIRFPTTPGKANWAYCTLAGVPVSNNTVGEHNVLLGKNINTYEVIAGLNSTQNGFTASGEFVDITHGTDWLHARMGERVFATIKNASDAGRKIPMSDSGVDTMKGAVYAQLEEGAVNQFLARDPAFTVTAPLVKNISVGDRATRTLPDVNFEANFAGAINNLKVNGVISV